MNQGNTADAEEMTEAEAKAEIERTQAQIEVLFEQMKRDREESRSTAERIEAKMADARLALFRLQTLERE